MLGTLTIEQLGFFSVPHILHLHKSRYRDIVPLHRSRNQKVQLEDARDVKLLLSANHSERYLFNQSAFTFHFNEEHVLLTQ